MQKKMQSIIIAILVTGLLVAPIAEAKRVGGGRSVGMQRSTTSQSYNNSNYRQQPVQQQSQRPKSNVGGMVAAGVAGAAVGALATNALADNKNQQPQATNTQKEQEKESGISWMWLILLAGGAFFLFRMLKSKKTATAGNNGNHNIYAPNQGSSQAIPRNSSAPSSNTNIFGQSLGSTNNTSGVYTQSGNALADGTEPATFLRFARQRFNHIQAMNNPSNVQEIKKYFTPELYQAIVQDVANNNDVAEFSNLVANIVDQSTENNQYVVSVNFSGTVSEDLNSLPQPFSEVWHFVKPTTSRNIDDWLVAGIQQA